MQHRLFKAEGKPGRILANDTYLNTVDAFFDGDKTSITLMGRLTYVPECNRIEYFAARNVQDIEEYFETARKCLYTRPVKLYRVTVSHRGGRLNLYLTSRKGKVTNRTNNPALVKNLVEQGALYRANEDRIAHQAFRILTDDIIENYGLPRTREVSLYDHDNRTWVTRVRALQFEEAVLAGAYPVFRFLLDDPDWAIPGHIPPAISGALRQPNIKVAVRRLFGFVNKPMTKAFIKAIKEGRYGAIEAARMVQDLLPVDYVAEIVANSNMPLDSDNEYLKDHLRSFFVENGMSAKRIKRFMTEESYFIFDTLRMWVEWRDQVDLSRCRDFQEAHDALTRHQNIVWQEARRLKTLNREIPQDKYLTIDGVEFGDGYHIVTPKWTHEMMDWGSELSHCIGSYVNEAVEERALYLAIYQSDTLVATAEIGSDRWSNNNPGLVLRQLYGKMNRTVGKDVAQGFIDALFEHELLTSKEIASERWAQDQRNDEVIVQNDVF